MLILLSGIFILFIYFFFCFPVCSTSDPHCQVFISQINLHMSGTDVKQKMLNCVRDTFVLSCVTGQSMRHQLMWCLKMTGKSWYQNSDFFLHKKYSSVGGILSIFPMPGLTVGLCMHVISDKGACAQDGISSA